MAFETIQPTTGKEEVKKNVIDFFTTNGYKIVEEDFEKPWGGYFRIADENLDAFIDAFFPLYQSLKHSTQKLRPKFLIVAPHKRLSWQYHHRRTEIWHVLFGPVQVMKNNNDEQNEPVVLQTDEYIELAYGERHRLIGDENWGIVAEIWKHTDPENPSEESDIVRVHDDFGR